MRDEFVGLLLGEVGQHEGRDPDGTWNNQQRYSRETPGLEWSDGQPWCATFECWGAHRTPGLEPLWPMTAGCSEAVAWWQSHGRWSQYPVLGGPFYIGPGGGTHTGVVVAYDATTITTVEGNSNPGGSPNGDGVYRRVRSRSSIYGYGVPAFPEGTVSADPSLGGRTSAAANPTPVQEDDMPLTPEDVRTFLSTPLGDQYAVTDQWGGRFVPTVADALNGGAYSTAKAEQALAAIAASQAAITVLATQLGQVHGVDTATVVKAVQDAIARATVNVHVDVTGGPAAPKGN